MKRGLEVIVLVATLFSFFVAVGILGMQMTGNMIIVQESEGIPHIWETVFFLIGVTGLSVLCYVRRKG